MDANETDATKIYNEYKHKLNELEALAESDLDSALEKMIDLYIETHKTFCHDISDSLNVWIFEKGSSKTIVYLKQRLECASSDYLKKIFQAWIDAAQSRL